MREGLICKCAEGCGYLFAKFPLFPTYPSDINQTAYIAGWQAHHHHQLYFFIRKKVERKSIDREVEINVKYKINITVEKRV